jgi:hypothetical protein
VSSVKEVILLPTRLGLQLLKVLPNGTTSMETIPISRRWKPTQIRAVKEELESTLTMNATLEITKVTLQSLSIVDLKKNYSVNVLKNYNE